SLPRGLTVCAASLCLRRWPRRHWRPRFSGFFACFFQWIAAMAGCILPAMAEIGFYHLTRKNLEQVLPELLEKTLQSGTRAVVRVGSVERAEALTQHLWTYNPNNFLPHGNAKDGNADRQPIWLTAEDENPNKAAFLFLADGADSAKLADYK